MRYGLQIINSKLESLDQGEVRENWAFGEMKDVQGVVHLRLHPDKRLEHFGAKNPISWSSTLRKHRIDHSSDGTIISFTNIILSVGSRDRYQLRTFTQVAFSLQKVDSSYSSSFLFCDPIHFLPVAHKVIHTEFSLNEQSYLVVRQEIHFLLWIQSLPPHCRIVR